MILLLADSTPCVLFYALRFCASVEPARLLLGFSALHIYIAPTAALYFLLRRSIGRHIYISPRISLLDAPCCSCSGPSAYLQAAVYSTLPSFHISSRSAA
jgi:hypothetical protein